jgi:hypothetical protein
MRGYYSIFGPVSPLAINDRYSLSRDKTPHLRTDGVNKANTFKSDRRWKSRLDTRVVSANIQQIRWVDRGI